MKWKITGIIISLIASTSIACDQPVTYLTEGETAPCTGYLFSQEKELEVRVAVEENKQLYMITETQDQLIKNLEKQNSLLETKDRLNDLEKFAYFIGGAIITALIASGVD
jgi:hypothetical protein